jgi:hypothetical protein
MGHGSTTGWLGVRGAVIGAALVTALCAGCPTVDLGDTPPDPGICTPDMGYFQTQIWPNYLDPPIDPASPNRTCAQANCHDSVSGRSGLRLKTMEPIDYAANYAVVTQYLNCGNPDSSELLTKPLAGIEPHVGGDIFPDEQDAQAQVFLKWFGP